MREFHHITKLLNFSVAILVSPIRHGLLVPRLELKNHYVKKASDVSGENTNMTTGHVLPAFNLMYMRVH